MPFVEEERRKTIQSEKDDESVEGEIDNEFFLTCITDRKKSLDSMYNALARIEGDRFDARFDYKSLLPDLEGRYENTQRRLGCGGTPNGQPCKKALRLTSPPGASIFH